MILDPDVAAVPEVYRLLTSLVTPRPIAWVSTISAGGVANLAPFSFFNAFGANPPVVVFSPTNRRDGSKKDTLRNVEAVGEFVINIVSHSLVGPMNESAAEVGPEVSEFGHVGLTAVPSEKVKPPRVGEAMAHLECEVMQILPIGSGAIAANLVIGRVRLFHVRDEVLGATGEVDAGKLDAVSRLGGNWYATTRDRFALERPK